MLTRLKSVRHSRSDVRIEDRPRIEDLLDSFAEKEAGSGLPILECYGPRLTIFAR